eukprot:TRINITY_DN192_c0_g2_i1.p1 TRINITY_DN192_c0_g2~~TRINITY_DN192_c0_g2_i1.p1  ORF type:complete len:122 (-),score=13.27 TRINITY_DN192_c0_g2_i1:602-967(-)
MAVHACKCPALCLRFPGNIDFRHAVSSSAQLCDVDRLLAHTRRQTPIKGQLPQVHFNTPHRDECVLVKGQHVQADVEELCEDAAVPKEGVAAIEEAYEPVAPMQRARRLVVPLRRHAAQSA